MSDFNNIENYDYNANANQSFITEYDSRLDESIDYSFEFYNMYYELNSEPTDSKKITDYIEACEDRVESLNKSISIITNAINVLTEHENKYNQNMGDRLWDKYTKKQREKNSQLNEANRYLNLARTDNNYRERVLRTTDEEYSTSINDIRMLTNNENTSNNQLDAEIIADCNRLDVIYFYEGNKILLNRLIEKNEKSSNPFKYITKRKLLKESKRYDETKSTLRNNIYNDAWVTGILTKLHDENKKLSDKLNKKQGSRVELTNNVASASTSINPNERPYRNQGETHRGIFNRSQQSTPRFQTNNPQLRRQTYQISELTNMRPTYQQNVLSSDGRATRTLGSTRNTDLSSTLHNIHNTMNG
ncbi:MAG: hypothetical protein K6D38_10975 [Pseudobutyrivibrio sp.]|nr:hypothetical protein [Pseudobutyrivibrio sp.]